MRRLPQLLLVALVALVAGGALACAPRRTLVIRTEPAGARVRLDDRYLGVTPLRIGFQHYGTRRITLYKEGYLTLTEQVRLAPPWYGRFPFDVFSEVLLPFGWHDRRLYEKTLVPGEEVRDIPSLRSVIERANVLREAGPEGPRDLPEPRPRVLPRREGPKEPPPEGDADSEDP